MTTPLELTQLIKIDGAEQGPPILIEYGTIPSLAAEDIFGYVLQPRGSFVGKEHFRRLGDVAGMSRILSGSAFNRTVQPSVRYAGIQAARIGSGIKIHSREEVGLPPVPIEARIGHSVFGSKSRLEPDDSCVEVNEFIDFGRRIGLNYSERQMGTEKAITALSCLLNAVVSVAQINVDR